MKNIKLLSWFNFCLDFRIFHAISVIYFAQITGSYAMALGLFSIARISSSVFEIPTGIFSDLIGRKWTIIFGQITTIISVLLYALGFNFWVLVVGAVLEGVGRSFFSGNNSAFLYDTLKENNLEKDFAEYEGRASSMFQFALGVSAILGSFVLGFYSYQIMYWLTLIPLSIGLIISFFFVEPKKPKKKQRVSLLTLPGQEYVQNYSNKAYN
jgi:MFS family permease